MDVNEMSLKQLPLTIIVAATPSNGIGKAGALPWPVLKQEMACFARVTKRVPMPKNTGSMQSDAWKQTQLADTRRNAVIMGRKTWESIPPRFRPLKDRTNVVISAQERSQIAGLGDDVVLAQSLPAALQALEDHIRQGHAPSVGRAFVIGGSSVYEAALQLPQTKSILLTRIMKEYDCDTLFPRNLDAPDSGWTRRPVDEWRDFTGEELEHAYQVEGQGDEKVAYEFQFYERDDEKYSHTP